MNFRQRDRSDCGAACLGYIFHHFGLTRPMAEIRRVAGTNRQGTTGLGLVETAQQFGFTSKGIKGPADALPSVPLPAIAHCLLENHWQHYVVLLAWTPKYAKVMDPALGRVEKWPPEKFKSLWTGVLILLAPGENFAPGDHTVPPLLRLWRLLRPHRAALTQALVGAAVSTLLALSVSVYVQKIVDTVIPDGNGRLLNLLGAAMLALLALRLVLGLLQALLSLRTAQQIDATLILAYYRHLLRLPQPFFDTMRVGEITSRVTDAIRIRNFLNTSLLQLILHPLIVLFATGAMFAWSWKLALLTLALVALTVGLYVVANWLNRKFQRELMERNADFDAQLVESLEAQPAIRHYQQETAQELKTEHRLVRLLRAVRRISYTSLGTNQSVTFLTQAYLILMLWIGARLVLDAGLTTGELMSCFTLASYLIPPLISLIGLNTSVQEALIATDRLFEVMDLARESDPGTIELDPALPAGLRCEAVSFKHAGRSATLQNLGLVCPPGRITALAGDSGSGKSTLLALLTRLYPPESGRIFIGEFDLQLYSLASLRRGITFVPQQTVLFSGSVAANIAPGERSPDMAKIIRVCRELGALEFIEKLPQGFHTHLNENGANLSGGQRQRLALARALYRDTPVLLLDEPSSALDTHAEELLAAALLRRRAAGRTVVLAAHSPRLLAIADHVVTLASGRPVAHPPPPPGLSRNT